MKIAFVTPWYPDERQPNSGVFIQTQAKALAKSHEVIVLSAKVDNSSFSLSNYTLTEFQEGYLHEYRLTIKRSLPFINQLHQLFITLRVGKRILKNKNVDILHSFIGYPGAFLGWLLSTSLNIPFVHTEHTRLQNNYRSACHKALTRLGMKKAMQLTAVSRWLADEIKTETQRDVIVIPNMIDADRFKVSEPPEHNIIQLGFLGGMNTNVKGLDVLLHAMALCKFDFKLHVGGSGQLLDTYKALAKELNIERHCIFYGFIPYKEVPGFFNKLHFFICSSRYETFNVSLVEAMVSGLPVISTRCGGPEEIISETTGLLVNKENPQALADGIQKLITERNTFSGHAIRLHAISTYDTNKVIACYEALYQSSMN